MISEGDCVNGSLRVSSTAACLHASARTWRSEREKIRLNVVSCIVIMSPYPGQELSTDELLFALGRDLERKLARYPFLIELYGPKTDLNVVRTHLSISRR